MDRVTSPAPVLTTLSSSVWKGFGVADINGDGNLDLVAPLNYGSSIAVLLGNGDGTFQAEQDLASGASYPQQLVLADLNGDGKLDVAVTLDQGIGQDIAYAMGNGDGTFGTFSIVPSSMQAYQLQTDPIHRASRLQTWMGMENPTLSILIRVTALSAYCSAKVTEPSLTRSNILLANITGLWLRLTSTVMERLTLYRPKPPPFWRHGSSQQQRR